MATARLSDYPSFAALSSLALGVQSADPSVITARADRLEACRAEVAGLHVDWSRQLADADVIDALIDLALWRQLPSKINAMMSGEVINNTEGRAVLHTALRAPVDEDIRVEGVNVVPDVHEVLRRMAAFAGGIRAGELRSATNKEFTDVVNIGIGGSDLGPAMAAMALGAYKHPRIRVHFVSNVDPTDIHQVTSSCDPETTMVLIASKTFTTAETMANARAARAWLVSGVGEEGIGRHLAAMSTAEGLTSAFGISPDRVFGFWDWVGGRYSVGSAIGLSLMIAIGPERFTEFLAGMRAVDVHFGTAPLDRNVPAILGLLAVWNRSFLGISSTAVLPYEQLLARFPAYLQQLTMESNGKHVTVDGDPVGTPTGAVYWGEPGTNGQHSFHQLLHQGTDPVACDVIAFAVASHPVDHQHEMLLANALAQTEVLATGRSRNALSAAGVSGELVAHKHMAGGRPTTLIIGRELTPHALGALIALYEHSVFTQGVLWGINSFDQWGVEYGKEVANSLLPMLTGESADEPANVNTAASLGLIKRLRAGR